MIVIGVGTKEDGKREIDQDDIEAFSRQCSAEIIVTSAKSGLNISESFASMASKVSQIQRSIAAQLKNNEKKICKKSPKIECNVY